MKVSENFDLREFVHPSHWSKGAAFAMKVVDARLFAVAQTVRDRLDAPIYINNWHVGGTFSLSGARPFDTSLGAKYSQHKFGRAIDLKGTQHTAKDIYNEISLNWSLIYQPLGVTRLEDINHTPTWVHVDLAYTDSGNLVIFKP